MPTIMKFRESDLFEIPRKQKKFQKTRENVMKFDIDIGHANIYSFHVYFFKRKSDKLTK